MIGGAVGLGICTNGPECSRTAEREHRVKVKEIELQEREQRLREQEIRSKEEQQAQQERQRETAEAASSKAKAEAAKQQSEESAKKKKSDEESKKTYGELEKGDWANPQKNKDAKNDSSASCEATKSCDGKMNATVIPEHMRENKHSEPLKDGRGNILGTVDLTGTPMPKDFSKKEKGIEPKSIIFDNKPLDWVPKEAKILRDGAGKVITTFEMTSTPMPGRN